MKETPYFYLPGETEVGSAEEQPTRDSQVNVNGGEGVLFTLPFFNPFTLLCLKKPEKSITWCIHWSYDTISTTSPFLS
jgi:hypothetical protein